ncbi:MAG: hypothetical protein L0220_27840, partial [Acidobacteria bacterium]|nr:hypothetical protein [Acidobacteriota bacterium]
GPLREWANDLIMTAINSFAGQWLNAEAVRKAWHSYCEGAGDNSYFVWQWISIGLISRRGGENTK